MEKNTNTNTNKNKIATTHKEREKDPVRHDKETDRWIRLNGEEREQEREGHVKRGKKISYDTRQRRVHIKREEKSRTTQ